MLAPMVLAVLIVGLWQLVVTVAAWPAFVLPSPGGVLGRLGHDLADPATWGYLRTTLTEALGGCLIGALAGFPLAVAIHESAWFSAAANPFLGATQAIPAIALAPLLVLWVGYGLLGVMVLCALMVFFPILVTSLVGLRHVSPEIVDAARMDGAGRLAVLWWIEAPLALPSALAGLRNGFTLSITGAVVGEMVMGGEGLGQVLTVQRDQVDTAGMFSTIILLCAVASLIYTLIRTVERRSKLVGAQLRTP
ncbi:MULTISPECIES: ABC transporter permease [unclassified Luteococcus]|uniref:ABC transporter permease n=1 Tax=unclassified Luteococcus TaxID=2639923 RepID=UPI00313AB468